MSLSRENPPHPGTALVLLPVRVILGEVPPMMRCFLCPSTVQHGPVPAPSRYGGTALLSHGAVSSRPIVKTPYPWLLNIIGRPVLSGLPLSGRRDAPRAHGGAGAGGRWSGAYAPGLTGIHCILRSGVLGNNVSSAQKSEAVRLVFAVCSCRTQVGGSCCRGFSLPCLHSACALIFLCFLGSP